MRSIEKVRNSRKMEGAGAFAVCSFFLLLGAAAGCFSGALGEPDLPVLAEGGEKSVYCLLVTAGAAGASLLLGSSCLGFVLIPLLSAWAGFSAALAMEAALLHAGSWMGAFACCGWAVAAALPVFLVFFGCAMRASAAVLGCVLFGTGPERGVIADFLKMFVISAVLSVLLAAAAAL